MLKRRHIILGVAIAGSLVVPALIAFGLLRLEVPRQHWFAHNLQAPTPALLYPLAALLLLGLTLWLSLGPRWKKATDRTLIIFCACCFFLVAGTRASSHMGLAMLATTVLCDGSDSYYTTACETPDVLGLAREYPQRMPCLRLHAATQSPGAVLVHAGLRNVFLKSPALLSLAEMALWISPCLRTSELAAFANSQWHTSYTSDDVAAALLIALTFSLGLSLGVFPTYALARRLAGRRAALVTAALYAVTPSFIWFTASIDQLYPALAVLIALLAHKGVQRQTRWLPLLAAGLLGGLGVFLNFGFSVALLAVALFVVSLTWVRDRNRVLRLLPWRLALFGGAALLVLVFVQFGLNINLIGIAKVCGELRTKLYLHDLPRPRLTWLLLNPVEFSLGLGFSSLALVLGALFTRTRRFVARYPLLLATLVALLLLDFSGAARAEWSRMLMFAMPLCLIGSAPIIRRLLLSRPAPAVVLVASQAAYALICYHLFDVWGYWIVPLR
ncbi:MAG: glycosyltransferase family 39 protein [Armatimonadota bacterium]